MVTPGAQAQRVTASDIKRWLEVVADPEIPVVSIVDLGIVREIYQEGNLWIVELTPTYSGCPATTSIRLDVEAELKRRNLSRFEVRLVLSPPWTTDWIGPAARQKLLSYGIAPPSHQVGCSGMLAAKTILCPQCGSSLTERVSEFGSTPCKASYQCRSCLEPFGYFKPF
jgi:ring-1,2-phenylacetyl-CoA epoxidase subunit PaaD